MLPVLTVLLLLAGCGAEAPPRAPFTKVDLPGGAVPGRITAGGDALLIGTRVHDKPGMLRYEDGKATEIPLTPATGYGAEAYWYSLTARDREILAVGGKTGGAHGNVRWSVWRTTANGTLAEQPQPFSTFGGLGGGALIDGVLPSTGPLLVGTWASHSAGADAMTWAT